MSLITIPKQKKSNFRKAFCGRNPQIWDYGKLYTGVGNYFSEEGIF